MKSVSTLSLLLLLLAISVFAEQSPSSQGPAPARIQERPPYTADDEIHHGSGYGQGQGIGRGSGQGHRCQIPGVDEHLQLLSSELSLTSHQQATMESLLRKQLDQMHAIILNESLSSAEKASKSLTLRRSSASAIREHLNDDQNHKFDELLHRRAELVKQGRANDRDCSMIWNAQ